MEAGPSYSKPRLCHLFLGESLCSRHHTREEIRKVEYSEMPVDRSSRCHASTMERAYCIPEFFDNSPIKLRLIRAESAAKEIHPLGSYASIFAPAFARGWPLRSVSSAVTFTFAFRYFPLAPPSVRSALVRILTTDLHCLESFPPISTILPYRGSLSRALTTHYFFLLSGRARGRKRAISTFPTIKELDQSASYTSTAISSISTVVIN